MLFFRVLRVLNKEKGAIVIANQDPNMAAGRRISEKKRETDNYKLILSKDPCSTSNDIRKVISCPLQNFHDVVVLDLHL